MIRKTHSDIALEVLDYFETKYKLGGKKEHPKLNDYLAENIQGIIIRSLEVSYNDQLYRGRI